MTEASRSTAGEQIDLHCEMEGIGSLLEPCSSAVSTSEPASLRIRIEADRAAFSTAGWNILTRSAVYLDDAVVMRDVCTSGFDLFMRRDGDRAEFVFRRRPHAGSWVANRAMPSRARLITRSALLQFPALWWAGSRGRAPLHAPVVTTGTENVLLVGASGVGKTTLVRLELMAGGQATGDNVSVSDGRTVWGLVGPLRIQGGAGEKTSHGRREQALTDRAPSLVPDRVLILTRGGSSEPELRPATPEKAARMLITGTYIAGELRRFWPFAATLAAATGVGPPHPPVREIAETITRRLPCAELVLPNEPGASLRDMLGAELSSCA